MAGTDTSLLAAAIAGDDLALQRLLIPYQTQLMQRIARKLPDRLTGVVSPEDVLQETYVEVFTAIRTFVPQGDDAFERWIFRIADNHVSDTLRRMNAQKRGGGWRRVEPVAFRSTMMTLLDLVCADSHTPSRASARDEAVAAMQVALAGLKPEYREALCLRYLEGLSVEDVAGRMGRSPWSVHKLCRRGMERLRESMGEMSRFFSVK